MAFISSEHKNKMYKSERMAIIAVLLIVVIIIAVFCFAGIDKKDDKPDDDVLVSDNSNQNYPDGAQDSADSSDVNDSSAGKGDDSSAPIKVDEPIEFETIKIENSKLSEGNLVLVNKDYEYKVDNIENTLINVYKTYSTQNFKYTHTDLLLVDEVAKKLNEMCADFTKATNLTDILLSTSYVSSETQQGIYDKAKEEDKAYTPKGGFGEHQTGLCFNLTTISDDFVMGENQYAWFNNNCFLYGFVIRYPEGKENITSMKSEPNHFRYVGAPHSMHMYREGIVLEEYIGMLKNHNYKTPLQLSDGSTTKYKAYACKASDGAITEIMVPSETSGWTYNVSGTNAGYFIVTIQQAEK